MTNIEIYDQIIIELSNFKFNRNSIAYEYLIDAIFIVTKNRIAIKDFNYYVYSKIGQRYRTKPQNVLWCISKLINLMYINTDENIISDYFKINVEERLSTKAFINGISRNIIKRVEILTIK